MTWADLCTEKYTAKTWNYIKKIAGSVLFSSQYGLRSRLGHLREDLLAELALACFAVLDPTRTVSHPGAYFRMVCLNRLRSLVATSTARPELIFPNPNQDEERDLDGILAAVARTGFRRNRQPMFAMPAPTVRLDLSGLTPIEMAVAERLASGDRQADVARDLGVSRTTVSKTVARLRRKLWPMVTNGAKDRSISVPERRA